MKTQEHNTGDLDNLSVEIEKDLLDDLKLMSDNSGVPVADIVAIAIKRFRSSHADYMKIKLDFP